MPRMRPLQRDISVGCARLDRAADRTMDVARNAKTRSRLRPNTGLSMSRRWSKRFFEGLFDICTIAKPAFSALAISTVD
uniref:Uncharacterized protein n=1 Tax=mine drainage metagenome TaxID=410659 RepID=E6PVF0_9ZZZZ